MRKCHCWLNMLMAPDLRMVLGLQQGLEGRHIRVVGSDLRRESAFEKVLKFVTESKLTENMKHRECQERKNVRPTMSDRKKKIF